MRNKPHFASFSSQELLQQQVENKTKKHSQTIVSCFQKVAMLSKAHLPIQKSHCVYLNGRVNANTILQKSHRIGLYPNLTSGKSRTRSQEPAKNQDPAFGALEAFSCLVGLKKPTGIYDSCTSLKSENLGCQPQILIKSQDS